MSDEPEVYPIVIRETGNDTQILYDLESFLFDRASSYQLFLPGGVDLYDPNDSTDNIQYTLDENTSEYEGNAITVTSISSDETDLEGMVLRVLPEAQVGDIIYIKPQSLVSQIMDEQFPEGTIPGSAAFDNPWTNEDVDPENFGVVSNDGEGQMDILWSDVPYAFKRSFPAYPSYAGDIFGGENGWIKNIIVHIGALGEISQEMAEAFESGGREDAYVPSVVYFGLQVIGALSSNSIYIILAHTELAEDFESGDILSGPTTNVLMLLAPEDTSIMNLTPYNDFLGGGATDISLVGPSGIGEDGEFDPIVFSETPVAQALVSDLFISDKYNNRILGMSSETFVYVNYLNDSNSSYPEGITVDDLYIYYSSWETKIIKRLKSDFSFETGINVSNAEYKDLAVDQTYLYVVDHSTDYGHNKMVKYLKSDLTFVDEVTRTGIGYNFNNPTGVAVDDSYVYISDTGNNRICKFLVSDLSFVHQIYDTVLITPGYIAVDDTYLYIVHASNLLVKRLKSDLSLVDQITIAGAYFVGISVDETYIYLSSSNANNSSVSKRLKSDFSFVAEFGSYGWGLGEDNFAFPVGIACMNPVLFSTE